MSFLDGRNVFVGLKIGLKKLKGRKCGWKICKF